MTGYLHIGLLCSSKRPFTSKYRLQFAKSGGVRPSPDDVVFVTNMKQRRPVLTSRRDDVRRCSSFGKAFNTKKGTTMARYISLLRFTEQGAKNIKKSTNRAHDFDKLAAKAGVKVEGQYWTMGKCDGVLILTARQ